MIRLATILVGALMAAVSPQAATALTQILQSGDALKFTVETKTGWFYVLDRAENVAGPWVEQRLITGTGLPEILTDAINTEARFYRLREFSRVQLSKPGAPFALSLTTGAESSALWSAEGELPDGLSFAAGRFSGAPTTAAAEKYTSGDYTNIVRLSVLMVDPETGDLFTGLSSAEIVHHVRLSYARNIYPSRPGGPSFGGVCIECHGSGFPPNFSTQASTLLGARSGSGGACPNIWDYVKPGDANGSLIYQKLVAPPCGDRMPQGGPYFNETQINRLVRWISELQPGETD